LQRGWFPTMQRTLGILEKIYRVLEMSTFQGLAQEAVDLCIFSLKQASSELARRPLPPTAGAGPTKQALTTLTQAIDSHLFLIRHLLALRERVAAFECDLVVNEKYFNFSNVWEAMQFKLPDGLLGILKPTVSYSQVDSKKDIEAELKTACEALITNVTAHITQPLASLNGQISDFLGRPGVNRMSLKDQPFMAADTLRDVVAAFLANVRHRVPFASAHIRMYLAAGVGAVSSAAAAAAAAAAGRGGAAKASSEHGQSTASILFKPVEMRLVDTWGRLEGLFEECQVDSSELDALGFIRPSALRELVASLFESTMSAPWPQLVEIVSQVPRTKAAVGAAPARSIAAAGSVSLGATPPAPPLAPPATDAGVPAASEAAAAGEAAPSAGASPVSPPVVPSQPVPPPAVPSSTIPAVEGAMPEGGGGEPPVPPALVV